VLFFTQASIYRDENNILDLYILLLRFTRLVCRVLLTLLKCLLKVPALDVRIIHDSETTGLSNFRPGGNLNDLTRLFNHSMMT